MKRFLTIGLGCALAALLATTPARAQSATFSYFTSFSPAFTPSDVRVADVVGSSAKDILVLSGSTSIVRIIENVGLSQLPPETNVAVGSQPQRLITTDANGDGTTDILTANAANVTVLLRTGATWSRTDYPLAAVGEVAVFDLNGDGLRDLVRGNQVAYGTVGGGFSTTVTTIFTPTTPQSDCLLGDFNGDGAVDFVTLTISGSNLILDCYRNAGAGTVMAPVTTSVPLGRLANTPGSKDSVADMDEDGKDDLVLARDVPATPPYVFPGMSLSVWSGQAAGTFSGGIATQILCEPSSSPYAIDPPTLEDLNGDGHIDVLVRANVAQNLLTSFARTHPTVSLLNTGSGFLYDPRVVTSDTSGFNFISGTPPAVARCQSVGDISGDGIPDLVSQTGGFAPATNILVFLGSNAPAPNPASLSITVVSGQNQTLPNSSNAGIGVPLVVEVQSNGQPTPGATVIWQVTSGHGMSSYCATTVTDAFGRTTNEFITGAATGPITMTATIPNGQSVTFNAQVFAMTASIASGNNQTITLLGLPPTPTAPVLPLVVNVKDSTTNAPIANARVIFAAVGNTTPSPIVSPTSVFTDAQGNAALVLNPTATINNLSITATIRPAASSMVFTVTIAGPTIQIVQGSGQAADAMDFFAAPLEVVVNDASGQPLPNVPVTFTAPAGALTVTASTVVTNPLGRAQTTAQVTGNFGGADGIDTTIPWSTTHVVFNLFMRRLTITAPTGSGLLTFKYVHEHGPTPLILTVEAPPQPSVVTPYGTLATSILAPLPGLVILDASGSVGILDPGLVANPNFTRTYTIPGSLAGFTFVSQILGFDAFYYPAIDQAIFISNAVVTTL